MRAFFFSRRLRLVLMLALIAMCALGSIPAQAATLTPQTFTVNSTLDVALSTPPDGTCNMMYVYTCTLRIAIQEANAAPGSTIVLPTGVYTLNLVGKDEDAALSGDLDITANVTITGAGYGATIITGKDGWDDGIFDIANTANVHFSNLAIQHGTRKDGGGGGIRNRGALSLDAVEVSQNSALGGGGIYNYGSLWIDHSVVADNSNPFNVAGGGGITNNDVQGPGQLHISNSTLSGNVSSGEGGALQNGGTATLTNVTISGNQSAGNGGGITAQYASSTILNNVTIADNTADSDHNESGDGGGVSSGSGFSFRNTIIAGNHDLSTTTRWLDCTGQIVSQGYNLVESTTGCTIQGDTTGNHTNTPALLGALTANSFGTPNMPLLEASPAVNAGNPLAPGSGGNACAAIDQLGKQRPKGGRCDMGAWESFYPSDQTISPGPLPDRTLGDPPFTLSPSASSGLPVFLTSETASVCLVSGYTVTLQGSGVCNILASQDGDANYNPAHDTLLSFVVHEPAGQLQTISFGPLPNRYVGDPPFQVNATASSGLPVSFTTDGACSISGASITLNGQTGNCTVNAHQSGNAHYAAAQDVVQTFHIIIGSSAGTSIYLPVVVH